MRIAIMAIALAALGASAVAAQPLGPASCAAPAGETVLQVGGASPTHASLSAAVNAANAAADPARITICLAAGTYVDDFAQIAHDVRIVGVGGLAHLQAVASPPNGKAILVTNANVEIENVAFSGASVPDRNGAGIRWESGDLTLRGAQFFDNENGVLSAASASGKLTIEDSRFLRNGFGDGQSHGVYVTSTTAELEVERSYFEAQRVGHQVKSRAALTVVRNSTFEDGAGGPGELPSYSIDLPYRGVGVIENNVLIQRDAQGNPGDVNKFIVNYGGEADPAGADALTVAGNVFVNERHPGTALRNPTPVVAGVSGNRFVGIDQIAEGPAALAANQTGGLPPIAAGAGAVLALRPDGIEVLGAPAGLPQTAGVVGESGLAALDGRLFVANRQQGIGALDPSGVSTFYFGPQGIEALGADGGRLLAAVFGRNEVLAYSADGILLETVGLQAPGDLGIAGLDSDGQRIFAGSFNDGDVYVFDLTGVLEMVIDTGLPMGWLSALAWDPFDGSLLVGAGFGDGAVRRIDLAGALLATYQAAPGIGGLAVATPEPETLGLIGLALLALGFGRRRLDAGRPRP